MAIDHIVDFGCVPKQTLGSAGILERLKGQARAEKIISLYRRSGDMRSPSDMGFELSRTNAQGEEETQVVVVQWLLDAAAELEPLAHHCVGCPANVTGRPFGCMNFIQYPISAEAEIWLLKQMPSPEEPIPWLLLRQTALEMGYTGAPTAPLRATGSYFQETNGFARDLGEFQITTNQLFEMMFLLGDILPAHAGALLLFLNAIPRNDEAQEVTIILDRALPPSELRQRFPFQQMPEDSDDATIREIKQWLYALWHGWSLNARILMDV